MNIEIPETFADLADEALTELADRVKARAAELAEADFTDEVAAELSQLADAKDAIRAEFATRTQAAAERAAKRDELMSRFADSGEADSIIPENPEPAPAPAAEAKGEAVEPAVTADAAVLVEAADALRDALHAAKDLVVAAQPGASMNDLRPEAAAPHAPRAESGPVAISAFGGPGKAKGEAFADLGEVSKAILDRINSWGQFNSRIPEGVTGERHAVATILYPTEGRIQLTGDYENDFALIREAQREHAALVASGDQALVASSCAPFAPIYEFFRLAKPQNPVEASTPSMSAPRGGIRYIVPPDYTAAAAGIGWRTSAEDANPATADFPVVTVTCPTVQDAAIEMVVRRVRWKNLNYRAFPEQVEAFTSDLMVMFQKSKEVRYLDAISTASTAAVGIERYGAARSLLYDLDVSAINYRQRQNMDDDAVLQVILPNWAKALIRRDIAAASNRIEEWQVTNAMVEAMVRALGLAPTWSYYAPTAVTGGDFAGAIADLGVGAAGNDIRDFPTEVHWFMYAPGTFVRIDTGSLDVGPVRDSALNGSNELELFAEEWTRIVKVGIESVHGTSKTKANGALPPAAAALIPA